MEKSYRIIIAGNFHELKMPTKVDYIVSSENKECAINKISKRYKNIFSIRARLMFFRTIKLIFKTNQR